MARGLSTVTIEGYLVQAVHAYVVHLASLCALFAPVVSLNHGHVARSQFTQWAAYRLCSAGP